METKAHMAIRRHHVPNIILLNEMPQGVTSVHFTHLPRGPSPQTTDLVLGVSLSGEHVVLDLALGVQLHGQHVRRGGGGGGAFVGAHAQRVLSHVTLRERAAVTEVLSKGRDSHVENKTVKCQAR